MTQYDIRFRRYDKQRGEMRISDLTHVHAESFGEAYGKAALILGGMRDADPEREYDIANIIHMFETRDEMAVRLKKD
jgi:hypothetical protein